MLRSWRKQEREVNDSASLHVKCESSIKRMASVPNNINTWPCYEQEVLRTCADAWVTVGEI